MHNSKSKLIVRIVVVLLLLFGLAFYYIYTTKVLDRIKNKKTDPEKITNTSVFKSLSENDKTDVDALLAQRIQRVTCEYPVNMEDSITADKSVPGIKPDSTTEDDYWVFAGIKPVILSYETFENINYFIGGLKIGITSVKKLHLFSMVILMFQTLVGCLILPQ